MHLGVESFDGLFQDVPRAIVMGAPITSMRQPGQGRKVRDQIEQPAPYVPVDNAGRVTGDITEDEAGNNDPKACETLFGGCSSAVKDSLGWGTFG